MTPEKRILKTSSTRRILPLLLAVGLSTTTLLQAEEGGSGHYFPSSFASFMDGVSATPTFILRTNLLNYSAGVDAKRALPIAGLTAFDVDVDSNVVGLTAFWRPEWGTINEQWSYAMSATVPFVDITVKADVVNPLAPGGTIRRSDSASGLGDILLMPLMLNYQASKDLAVNMRMTVYAPTGEYNTGELANTGKNFWTVEPEVALMYMGQQNQIEGSLFFGVDFNQENADTNYKSGSQAHLDGTLAKHFPLWGGLAGLGATGYWYEQIEGDSGEGATFGDFKSRAMGLGPVASWVKKAGDGQLLAEFKWLNEFNTKNRPEGNIAFLKIMYRFD